MIKKTLAKSQLSLTRQRLAATFGARRTWVQMDDRLYRVFGARLRELREEKSVTQEELARRVDLSRTSITNIEKGRQRVMLHQMVDLARALDAAPERLLPADDAHSPPALRPDVAAVVEGLRRERDPKD